MTENEMIWAMWRIIGDMPISRAESMGEELYYAVHDYLYGFDDEEVDEFDSDACFDDDDEDNEEEEIFGDDDDV